MLTMGPAGRWILVFAIALAAGAGAYVASRTLLAPEPKPVTEAPDVPFAEGPPPGPAIPDRRPDVTLADRDGKPRSLAEWNGRPQVINFWATWCAPCRKEIPWLVEIFHQYRDQGLMVLGVSVDEDVARIAPFAASLRMDFPVLVGRDETEFRESFGPLLGFPTTLLITRGGDICLQHKGITQQATLEAGVRELLAAR
jgi:thiol-disulfide isomerase/thioredoxin